ncbi:MMPL family transporter [Amycolatopsis pithecellobii]|uniref:MMPL family transporter n=1 Tax=Amycolatopsis pithecellobii TaxID=664692 RepID=A0A6N7Z0H3_9PSEU|nr:MMPL family transporter [Amycolatopsis pithecellobii]MTD53080.1 MMPL family transporter [Amycolatopsis pithecellobii]
MKQPPDRLARTGRWCAGHPWPVLLVWLAVLAGATVANSLVGGTYSDDFTLPGAESGQGSAVLAQHGVVGGGNSARIVFNAGSAPLPAQAVEQAAAQVRAVPHVVSVSDPLSPATTSPGGQVVFANVQFDNKPTALGQSLVDGIDQATAGARAPGLQVDYSGTLGKAAEPAAGDFRSELVGIVVAILVLLVAFGSVLAAALPIVTSIIGVVTGLGILGLIAATTTFATASPTLAIMIGLGVGIDYALFLTTRFRQHMIDGGDPVTAAGRTVATSGRSVLIAATTVVIALMGLFAVGVTFIGKLGLAAAVTVVIAGIAAITLVPALLGLAGRRIDRWHVRRPVAEQSADGRESAWHRYAVRVDRHPWRFLGGGVLVAAVLAIPAFSLQLGHIDEGADPAGSTTRQAYDAISAGFGPGVNGQFTVVIVPAPGAAPGTPVQQALARTPGVASATPLTPSQDGALLLSTVTPATGPQDAATDQLLGVLRTQTLPPVLDGSRSYVTGMTAGQLDFRDIVAAKLPLIIGVVVAAAFVLLLLSFRSPLLALKAAVLNLLSIAASYGVIVAVFQWGWGGSLLGVSERVPIESYVPMIMFAIVFGLSMDYEVFLLSRVHEAWLRTKNNHIGVADGLAVTARVITSAALIMMCVFFAFLVSPNVVIKILALGLGVSVLIDATIIRLIIVPAAMFLLGKYSWWLPDWLDRALPHLEPEPETLPAPAEPLAG